MDLTFAGLIEAARGRDAVFLEDARSDRTITYAELAASADAWVSVAIPDSPVALTIADPLDFAVTYISLLAAGATVLPLDPKAPEVENQKLMQQAGASQILTGLGPAADSVRRPDDSSDRVGAVLLFSSGSTGARKLIRLEQTHLLCAARLIAEHHELKPGERGYNSLPLHHVNAEVVAVLGSLVGGATIVLDAGFHKTGFWDLINERTITWINAVPAIITILSAEPRADYLKTPMRFIRSASAPLPIAVLERFQMEHHMTVVETYGMTEAASQITANPVEGIHKPGSVGLPVGVELRVVDHNHQPVETKQVGSVEIRGESVVTSYVGGAAADRFTADNWLETGDQGFLDEDGYVFLVGRTDDVINNGGEKIFPREIEEAILTERAVREALVVPLQDNVKGQVPVALVTLVDNADQDEVIERLTEFLNDVLSKPRRPTSIIPMDELPRGVTGKLSRQAATKLVNGG